MYKERKRNVYHTNLNVHLITERFDHFIWISKKSLVKEILFAN